LYEWHTALARDTHIWPDFLTTSTVYTVAQLSWFYIYQNEMHMREISKFPSSAIWISFSVALYFSHNIVGKRVNYILWEGDPANLT